MAKYLIEQSERKKLKISKLKQEIKEREETPLKELHSHYLLTELESLRSTI